MNEIDPSPLRRALHRALAGELHPLVRNWFQGLLAGDATSGRPPEPAGGTKRAGRRRKQRRRDG